MLRPMTDRAERPTLPDVAPLVAMAAEDAYMYAYAGFFGAGDSVEMLLPWDAAND